MHHLGGRGRSQRLPARPLSAPEVVGLGDDVLHLLPGACHQSTSEPHHLLGHPLDDLLRSLLDRPVATRGIGVVTFAARRRRLGHGQAVVVPGAACAVSARPSPVAGASPSPLAPRATPRAAAVATSVAFRTPATPYTAPRRSTRRTRGERATAVAATATATSESR